MSAPPISGVGLPLLPPHLPTEGALGLDSSGLGSEAIASDGFTPFVEQLKGAIANHSLRAQQASQKAEAFARGENDDIHGTMIAVKQVDIELRVLANVRSKLLDSFNELWRMSV